MFSQRSKFALTALCVLLPGLSSARAENDDWRNYFSIREIRQPASNAIDLKLAKKAEPNIPFFLPQNDASKKGMFGVDVSHWDFECDCPSGCSIDWRGAASKQGIRFAYAEATNGNESTAGIDKAFLGTWQALKPLHEEGLIYRGAFHWLSSNPLVSGTSQAQWFLKNVNDGGAHLAHALDFEPDFVEVTKDTYDAIKNKTECKTKVPQGQTQTKYFCDGWYGQTADAIIAKIAEWIKVIEDNHQTAMIYTTQSFWDKMIGAKGADILTARGVWLARYLDPKQFPTSGMPQSILSPVNKWGMPPLPKNVSYPTGATYSSRTNWQFEQCGEFRQTVWTCKGKTAAGPAPDKMACPTASGAVMDMNWYPSSLSDFKSAFGIN